MKKLFLGLFFLITSLSTFAFADYPEKAIRVIVPYKAGGGTDTIARGFVGPSARLLVLM